MAYFRLRRIFAMYRFAARLPFTSRFGRFVLGRERRELELRELELRELLRELVRVPGKRDGMPWPCECVT